MNTLSDLAKYVYYDQDGVVVRNSKQDDVFDLFWRMRKSDIHEIWASHHATPKDALKRGFKNSFLCLSILINNKVIAMFGISTEYLMGERATIWLLAAPELEQIKLRFLKHSRKFVDMFLEYYPILENYVHANNRASIKWLKFLRAEIDDPKHYGVENELFHYFKLKRKG